MIANDDPRPYKKVARAEAQERTREALLDAALDEFSSGHWQKTPLEKLARSAGVTKQTLLRHFGSKEQLFVQALMRGASQVLDQRWNTPTDDTPGAVSSLLDHYAVWGELALRIGAWQNRAAFLASVSQGARQVHYDWVDRAFGSRLQRLEEPERSRRRASLIAVCDVHTWHLLSHDLRLSRQEMQATLTDAIQALLGEGN